MLKQMTRSEFYNKYGDVEVTFSSYYKYTFNYTAVLVDGKLLTVGYGGSSDQIYRYNAYAGQTVKVKDLQPYNGSVYKDTEEVESFYDY